MLAEAKKALRVTVSDYDGEIMRLAKAGARDLEVAGVLIQGEIAWETDEAGTVTDTSTLEDALLTQAILTYIRANFGSPADYDKVLASYETQKVVLMHADGYTEYGDGDGA